MKASTARSLSAALWLISSVGCAAPDSPLRITLGAHVQKPPASVVVFLADGLDRGRLAEMVAAGRLPSIDRLFVRGGVEVEHAVASIPAMTYPNTTSIMTGRFPGHHGVVGNQWFDRRSLESPDYITLAEFLRVNQDLSVRTLYEMLPDHPSVNIQCNIRRGASYDADVSTPAGLGWFLGLYAAVDQLVGGSFDLVGDYANLSGRWPSLVVLYFPGLDELGHNHGPRSTQYEHDAWNIDCQVGRVTDMVRRAGMAERTTYVLVTDHGMISADPTRRVDVLGWLATQAGLRVHEGPIRGATFAERMHFANRFDAIAINGSHRRVAVDLRGPAGWCERPSPEAVRARIAGITSLTGVGLACLPIGEGRVEVHSRRGVAVSERLFIQSAKLYRLIRSPDSPAHASQALGYDGDAALQGFVDSGWHPSREWLAATAASRYPDFIPQIVEYFDSPRAGDFIVFAEEGWVFTGHHAGAHGSAVAEDMCVPLYFSGPGLPAGGRIPCARLVDVAPTIVELLAGRPQHDQSEVLDGVSLLSELKRAAPPKP